MRHLTKNEYFNALDVTELDKVRLSKFNRMYNRILEAWETPDKWFRSKEKTVREYSFKSDKYWIIWSVKNKVPLPNDVINGLNIQQSFMLVQNLLCDASHVIESISRMNEFYSDNVSNQQYSLVIYMCIYKGVSKFKHISAEDIDCAFNLGVLRDQRYVKRLKYLLYAADYVEFEQLDIDIIENFEMKKLKKYPSWTKYLNNVIEEFLKHASNIWTDKKKMSSEKRNGIWFFLRWYSQYSSNNHIQNLNNLSRNEWLSYIKYMNGFEKVSNKTKGAKVIAIKEFIEWLQTLNPKLISDIAIYDDDYKSFKDHEQKSTKAFEKREYGEKILSYLVNDFQSDDIVEKFIRESIIIAANSGMRISEIKSLEYKSCFYSEEEGLYKIILDYTDKMNQIDRPVYLTRDGYESIQRVEKLREELGPLKKVYDDKRQKKIIRLFEYGGNQSILNDHAYDFFNELKQKLGLVDCFGKPIKGAYHACRHFMAMTVFVLSNYNISVVRYLLGHRDYQMSKKYLDEEKFKYLERIKNQQNDDLKYKFSGKGLDKLVDLILLNDLNNYDYKRLINGTKTLQELIINNKIKKVGFGYCLNPCNKRRCIRCNNFLLTNENEEEILNAISDLFSLICFKKEMYSTREEFLSDLRIQEDIEDLIILLEEADNLGLDTNRIDSDLNGVGVNAINI